MPKYAQIDEHDLVVGIVTVFSGPAAGIEIADEVAIGRTALVAGELVDVGAAPSPDHVYRFGGWVLDTYRAAARMVTRRNQLLRASDWTQLPDVPLPTKAAWATYRQALRDITDQPAFPLAVEWPAQPA